MIIKLHRRMVAAIMLISSALILVSFSAIYAISYIRIQAEITDKLNRTERVKIETTLDDIVNLTPFFRPLVFAGPIILDKQFNTRGYFNIIADEAGKIFMLDSAAELEHESYEKAVHIILQKDKPKTVTLEGKKWRFMYETTDFSTDHQLDSTGEVYAIKFIDVTELLNYLQTLKITLMIVAACLLAILYFLSHYFASRAVQPLLISWEKQRQFIADASHELKTPLSIISSNVDMIKTNPEATVLSQEKWFNYINTGIQRMSGLVSNLLSLAKMEDSSRGISLSPIRIDKLLDNIIEPMMPLFQEKSITIYYEIPQLVLYSDPDLLTQVMTILLDNALKYTPEKGEVAVNAFSDKAELLITVGNSAVIPAQDLPNIFDRFYRGDYARSADQGSFGLGLAIAQTCVNRLGGKITANSENGQTIFTVAVRLR